MPAKKKQKEKENSSSNAAVTVAIITVLGTIIVTFISTFKEPITAFIFRTPSATPTKAIVLPPTTPLPTIDTGSIPEPKTSLSPAVQAMDQYYRYINNAGVSDDLSRAWELLTKKLQCNSSDNCNFVHYRDWWWELKVEYKLYDCGSNTVDTELKYYSRNASGASSSAQSAYVRYVLINESGQLKINSGEIITGISAYCELTVYSP